VCGEMTQWRRERHAHALATLHRQVCARVAHQCRSAWTLTAVGLLLGFARRNAPTQKANSSRHHRAAWGIRNPSVLQPLQARMLLSPSTAPCNRSFHFDPMSRAELVPQNEVKSKSIGVR
jgi:hypothetical protein